MILTVDSRTISLEEISQAKVLKVSSEPHFVEKVEKAHNFLMNEISNGGINIKNPYDLFPQYIFNGMSLS